MSQVSEILGKLHLQNAEFDALTALIKAKEHHDCVPVVDEQYQEARHNYEGALEHFIKAMEENGRFNSRPTQPNRYRLIRMEDLALWNKESRSDDLKSAMLERRIEEVERHIQHSRSVVLQQMCEIEEMAKAEDYDEIVKVCQQWGEARDD
ncbi:hypothetical protein [Alterisphingorhabdus coralli]|uniref:Uncharacterized protein n=1 Tax=Alterisphingorhabdus coralli TaxID=3071408 RepID=A0AA97I2F8_9SPHN|nr:hypothetical protein [Parasphingorhabdus sp. SCSIO 66989]WOE76350.1 hypothetical protein RB602_06455 [Parasphingorhabdus sp. SCSIO 66989]